MISEAQHNNSVTRQVEVLRLKLKEVLDILDSKKKTTINTIDTMITNMISDFSSLKVTYSDMNSIMNNRSYQRILVLKDSLEYKITEASKRIPYNDTIKANKIIPKSEIKLLREFLS